MLTKEGHRAWLTDCIQAVFISMALYMDMGLKSLNNYDNWFVTFIPHTMGVSAAAVLGVIALRWARVHLPKADWRTWAAGLFLGAWQILAVSVYNTTDIQQPFITNGQILKAVSLGLGMTFLFVLLIRLLEAGLNGMLDTSCYGKSRFLEAYRKHTMLFCAGIVLLCWMPQIAVNYPGKMNADTANQFRQAMGLAKWDANHPTFGTALIFLAVQIGKWTENGNIGVFLYIVIQAVLSAGVIGYSQQIMRRLGAPRWLRVLSLFVCGVMPVYRNNIVVILKDVPYSYAALLLMCELVRREILDDEAYRKSAGHLLRVAAAGLFLLKIRNNGALILVPVAVVSIVHAVRNAKTISVPRTVAVMLLPFVLSFAFDMGVKPFVKTEPASPREALSLPFQQTARFVSRHPDEVTEEEKKIIDRVVEYDVVERRYDPMLSDPIKDSYKNPNLKDLMRYFRVWAGQVARDPVGCIQATLIQNALLFDPQTYNIAIFTNDPIPEDIREGLKISSPPICEKLEKQENRLYWLMMGLPFVLQLNTLGFYCIVLICALAVAGKNKVRRMGLLFYPLVGTLIFLPFGPCIQNQDRYGFPIIYLMPLMLACLSYALKKSSKQ